MKIPVTLLLLLAPMLAGAQVPQPYQSPATVAKRLKAQCAAQPPQQRKECETRARGEIRASIAKHHEAKAAQKTTRRDQPAAKSRANPRADRKQPQ